MARKARIVVLDNDSGVLTIHETELDEPGLGQVLVEIFAAGVGYPELRQVVEPQPGPLLMGTEAFGRVRAAGAGVTRVKPGDYVVVTALGRGGWRDETLFSFEPEDIAAPMASSAFTFATDVLVDARACYAIPAVPDREAAAILGMTGATGAGAVMAAGVGPGQSVAVFGVAGVGLMAVAAAREAGASPIIAIDRKDARLALATKLGATHTINATTDQALARIAAICPVGVDHLFDSVYEYPTKNRPGAHGLSGGGRSYLLGAPGTDSERDTFAATQKAGANARLREADADAVIAALGRRVAEGTLSATAIVTNRYTIEGVNEALRDLENGDVVGQAIIVMEPLEFA